MKLPLLLSVPHAGDQTPDEVVDRVLLTAEDIVDDGDVGAKEIYVPLEQQVEAFHIARIARAFVDLNRAEGDRSTDGVVKTHTCWDVPVYTEPLSEDHIETLLARYYRPYHERLTELAKLDGVHLAIDCHTMAAAGPPVGPDPGSPRPAVCLSNADGTCPQPWIERLAQELRRSFELDVRINDPFRGGYITRSHADELPWVQLELSRFDALSVAEKTERVLTALQRFCAATWVLQ